MVSSNKKPTSNYQVGDEISYATGSGMNYGEVVRLLEGGQAIVELHVGCFDCRHKKKMIP